MKKRLKVLHARTLLAQNVAELRKAMELSQERLAEMAGFHRTYVSQVERGTTNATIDNVQKLADVLSVGVERLFLTSDGHDAP